MLSIVRKKQDSVRVLFQLARFLQIGGRGGAVGSTTVQLSQRYHQYSGSLCQLVQGDRNSRYLLIAVFGLAVCQ